MQRSRAVATEATPLLAGAGEHDHVEAGPRDSTVGVAPNDHAVTPLLGFWSVTGLVVGRIVGAGIFSTPGVILDAVGSIGASLVCWAIGGLAAFCGLCVWLEWATHYPRNGGDKVYLEKSYPRPARLTAYIFASRALLLGATPSACVIFSSNIQQAVGLADAGALMQKGIAVAALTIICLMHGLFPRFGLLVMNTVTAIKVAILLAVVLSGIAVMSGHTAIRNPGANLQLNKLFEGTNYSGALWASALFKTFNSFSGWSNASFVLGEVREARRTVVRSSLFGLSLCTVLYLLVIVAYCSAVPKEELTKTIAVAGLFAPLGNIVTITFTVSRVLVEIAREGTLPDQVASFWPCGSPLLALAVHWLPAALTIILPPPGKVAYSLILDTEGFTLEIFYLAITVGLFLMRARKWNGQHFKDTFECSTPAALAFAGIAVVMIAAALLPPSGHSAALPYWTAPACGLGIILVGAVAWLCSCSHCNREVLHSTSPSPDDPT